jgi:hypothetical protein
MSNEDTKSVLARAFASGILDSLQGFWFSHLQDETHIVVPSTKDINIWFVDKSDKFDESCRYVPKSRNYLRSISYEIPTYIIQHKIRTNT